MPPRGSRLLGDADEIGRFQPRGLSGGTAQRGPNWRSTRIEAVDKAAGIRAVVEEVKGLGWRYDVTGGHCAAVSGSGLSKEQAIADATRAMERRGATS